MVFSKLFSAILRNNRQGNNGNKHFCNQVHCNYDVTIMPNKSASFEEQIEWITQCELTLSTYLGIMHIYAALAKDMIGRNCDIIKAMANACDKISDCAGKESYDEASRIILDGIPDVTYRNTIGYLWGFYLESKKLSFANKRLQEWIYGRRIGNNAARAQLMLILDFSMNQYLDSQT